LSRITYIIVSAILMAPVFLAISAQAQTMEEIMREMAEAAKKGEQSQYSGTYNNYSQDLLGTQQTQQPYQPMTPQQSQQYTTNKLLRALSEASKRPTGETDYQRNQRLNNLTNEMRNQDAAISQRQNDYYNARTKRMLSGAQGNSPPAYTLDELAGTGLVNQQGTAGESDYARQRRNRLNTQNPTPKPAGFGQDYAGGFEQPSQSPSQGQSQGQGQGQTVSGLGINQSRSSGTAPDWGDDIDDLSAKDEKLKDAAATQSTPVGCLCKGGDVLVYGVQCVGSNSYGAAIDPPYYPWTQACTFPATIWSHESK
jgi:hypothetical protein